MSVTQNFLQKRCKNLAASVRKKVMQKVKAIGQRQTNTTQNPPWLTVVQELQCIYCLGETLSAYFVEKGIRQISIYSPKEDRVFADMVCKDFQVNRDIIISRFLSDYTYSPPRVWNYTSPPMFKRLHQTEFYPETEETILIISAKKLDKKELIQELSAIPSKKIIYLLDELPKISKYYRFQKPVSLFLSNNPHCQVITYAGPKYPSAHCRTENEQQMFNSRQTRSTFLDSLATDHPIIPKAYEGRNYTTEDLFELLSVYPQYETGDGSVKLYDRRGKLVNIVEGYRVTTDQPADPQRTIYIIGGCTVFGLGAEDSETLPSFLQRQLNSQAPEAKLSVMNYGAFCVGRSMLAVNALLSLSCNPGDIIFLQGPKLTGIPFYSFVHLFERPHNFGEVFLDCIIDRNGGHRSSNGQRALANEFYKKLDHLGLLNPVHAITDQKTKSKERADDLQHSKMSPSLATDLTKYKEHLLGMRSPEGNVLGAIVMNCNPFTLGHRYLIEYASEQVDHLYIFVVEEDRSFFPFKDRFALVKRGTEDLKNVTVLESGKFIISSVTFSDYFAKQELKDRIVDSSTDVTLFAEEIAPALNISVRFVGEEPLCNVTRQYNNTMKRILPQHGIELRIIPRKEFGNEPISASRVRALLETKDFDAIKKIVPETTYDYLVEKYS